MASSKKAADPALEQAVTELLNASREKGQGGAFVMSLEDRLSIIDRALKYEMLKHKIKDQAAGSGWDDPPPED